MPINNDRFFMRKGAPRRPDGRAENNRRAAIARAAMAPRDLSPAPHGSIKALRTAWRAACATSKDDPSRARTARLGRIRIATRGLMSAALRRGDLVLVWDAPRNTRAPMYLVWHPRNAILASVSMEQVDMVCEGPRPQGLLRLPWRAAVRSPKKR